MSISFFFFSFFFWNRDKIFVFILKVCWTYKAYNKWPWLWCRIYLYLRRKSNETKCVTWWCASEILVWKKVTENVFIRLIFGFRRDIWPNDEQKRERESEWILLHAKLTTRAKLSDLSRIVARGSCDRRWERRWWARRWMNGRVTYRKGPNWPTALLDQGESDRWHDPKSYLIRIHSKHLGSSNAIQTAKYIRLTNFSKIPRSMATTAFRKRIA